MTRADATIGAARTARTPRSASSLTPPSVASRSSGASRTSRIAIVRASRMHRFATGRRLTSPSGAAWGAHSARTSRSPGSPSRMKQRSTFAGLRGLLDRHAEQLVEVAAGAHLLRDPRDQPLALERTRQRGGGARPRERQAGLGCDRLHQRELLGLEDARLAHRGEDDADHLVSRPHRDERAALHLRDRVQPVVDDRRGVGVVHRERGALAHDRADARGFALQVDDLADQRHVVATRLAGRDDPRPAPLVLDQDEVGEVERVELGDLVEEESGDLVGVLGVEQAM